MFLGFNMEKSSEETRANKDGGVTTALKKGGDSNNGREDLYLAFCGFRSKNKKAKKTRR